MQSPVRFMSFRRRLATEAAVGALVMALALLPRAASAQTVDAGAPAADQATDPAPDDLDIVVTGVRAGLRSAISEKRNIDNIADVIKAEDIGKLPDTSVANSLQRVTGVQIIRNVAASRENNGGQPVNIRGLASNSLIDGRAILTGETTRDVDFRTLASGGFGALVVSKSPTADRIEGGLGGTIELVTRNPLEIKERVLSARAQGSYLDYAKSFNPDVSVFYGDSFADGRVGVVLSASYRRVETRQDQFNERGGWIVQNGYSQSTFDFTPAGRPNGNTIAGTDLIVPSDLRLNYGGDVQKRINVDGAIAFKATDTLTIKLNGDFTRFDRDFFNGIFRASALGSSNFVAGSGTVSPDGTLLAGTFRNQLVQGDGRLEIDDIQSWVYGFNAKWDADRLHATFDVANAGGWSKGRQLVNRFSLFSPATVRYDFTSSGQVPTIDVGGVNLEDRSLYRTDLSFNDTNAGKTREFSSRVDLGYDLDSFLNKISVGGRYTKANFKVRLFNQNNISNAADNPAVFDPATGLRRSAAYSGLDPLFQGFPVGGLFEGVSGSFPRRWLYVSYPGGSLDSAGAYGDIYNLDRYGKTENMGGNTNVTEQTLAGYVRADFKGSLGSTGVRGNIGVRVIKTDVSSIDWSTINAAGDKGFVKNGNHYVDVLPSATAIFDLTPKLLMRLAAGSVMRRPDLGSLRSPLSVQLSDNTASSGNIELSPFRANTIDASLEWYFAKDGLVSVAAFYKDVRNFTETRTQTNVDLGIPAFNGSTIYTITRPVNAGTAKIKGFEFSYQQAFTFLPGMLKNLGVLTNYTFSDAKTSQKRDFPGLSKHTANLIAYYDDGKFDFRAALNYRSKFVSGGDGSNGLQFLGIDEYVDSSIQLDLSTQYQLNPTVALQASVTNLTNEPLLRYTGTIDRVRDYRVEGSTFTAGVNIKF